MIKRFSIALLILGINSIILAQVPNDFGRINCAGPVPEDFFKLSVDKYRADVNTGKHRAKLSKKKAREYAAITNYSIDNMLMSGNVLYGDPLSVYATKIMEKLLANDQETLNKLRIYTLKSTQVNAFSTDQGIIFVTIGLMGKVENEAQLAYVLAHEIAHFKKNHNLTAYKKKTDIMSGKSGYRHLSMEERLLKTLSHSREAEFEADELGFEIYSDAGYNLLQANAAFDFLLYSYLPIEDPKIGPDFFGDAYYKLPANYQIKEINLPAEEEDVDDSELTHPNVHKRQEKIDNFMDEMKVDTSAPIYFISQKEFERVKELACFEMVSTYLKNNNFISSFYLIQILKKKYPDHPFLIGAECMAIYGMQRYDNNEQKSDYNPDYKEVEGEQQALFFLFSKLRRKELNVLAVKFLWEKSLQYPDNDFLKKLRQQSLTDFAAHVDFRSRFFLTDVSKIPVVDSSKAVKKRPSKYAYCATAFIKLFGDSTFASAYKAAMKSEKQKDEDDDDDTEGETEVAEDSREESDEMKEVNKRPKLDTLMMLSPRFFKVDNRKSVSNQMIKSELEEIALNNRVMSFADALSLELTYVDCRDKNSLTTDKFNEYALLVDWLIERTQFEGENFTCFNSRLTADVMEHYNTDYLAVNTVWSAIEKKEFSFGALVLSLILYPTIPFYIYYQFTPYQETEYTFVLFNLRSGELEYVDYKFFKSKYRKDMINAHLYNSLNQIKK